MNQNCECYVTSQINFCHLHKAAPALLEACKKVVVEDCCTCGPTVEPDDLCPWHDAKNAISQAEMKESPCLK